MKVRKKPVVVEAVQWIPENMLVKDILDAFGGLKGMGSRKISRHADGRLVINTLEGDMTASPGDWIIKGVHGELYPCKPDIFAETYEIVGGEQG